MESVKNRLSESEMGSRSRSIGGKQKKRKKSTLTSFLLRRQRRVKRRALLRRQEARRVGVGGSGSSASSSGNSPGGLCRPSARHRSVFVEFFFSVFVVSEQVRKGSFSYESTLQLKNQARSTVWARNEKKEEAARGLKKESEKASKRLSLHRQREISGHFSSNSEPRQNSPAPAIGLLHSCNRA